MFEADNIGATPEPDHPLAAALDRVVQVGGGHLKAQMGPVGGEGWYAAIDLLKQPAQIEDCLERMADHLRATDRRVPASFFFKKWCNLPLMVGLGCYLLEQMAPNLAVENLRLRVSDTGYVEEMALDSNSFAVLPTNPAAKHPDAIVVPDLAALHEYLFHTTIYEYFAPVIASLRPILPFGERFMWATVADTCAGLLTIIAKRLNQTERCHAEAERWVSRAPLKGKTGIVTVEWNGHSEIFLERGCCCFAYKLEQYGNCKTCPLLQPDERVRLLQAQMEEQLAQ